MPRTVRAKVFRIVRELFSSIGTLVSVGAEARLLPGLKVRGETYRTSKQLFFDFRCMSRYAYIIANP